VARGPDDHRRSSVLGTACVLRIDREARRFVRLERQTMVGADLTERQDVQQMILRSPETFFEELGERLLLIGQEIRPADFVDDRIDVLAIDENGNAVIIELKRGSHKLQLLQSLAYAGMVARWRAE
jgi:RecB family endonuclease NucS